MTGSLSDSFQVSLLLCSYFTSLRWPQCYKMGNLRYLYKVTFMTFWLFWRFLKSIKIAFFGGLLYFNDRFEKLPRTIFIQKFFRKLSILQHCATLIFEGRFFMLCFYRKRSRLLFPWKDVRLLSSIQFVL